MSDSNEVVMLLIGLGVFVFGILQRRHLSRVTRAWLLSASYLLLLVSWVFTVAEAYYLPTLLNLLEHACALLSALLLLIWTFALLIDKQGGAQHD